MRIRLKTARALRSYCQHTPTIDQQVKRYGGSGGKLSPARRAECHRKCYDCDTLMKNTYTDARLFGISSNGLRDSMSKPVTVTAFNPIVAVLMEALYPGGLIPFKALRVSRAAMLSNQLVVNKMRIRASAIATALS